MKYADRSGNFHEAENSQDRFTDRLYSSKLGSPLKKILVSAPVSEISGTLNDSKVSSLFIRSFIKKNGIDMSDYEDADYKSFNDFFCRKAKDGARVFDTEPSHLCSPCDGKVTAFELTDRKHFLIKGQEYTLESLLKSKKAARRFAGGTVVIIRLSVDDYHRYAYIDKGVKTRNIHIKGRYHTVNPHAAENERIYAENSREYTFIKTENFGTMVQMEVGAMMVGRIVNHHQTASVKRGMEKGYFKFGGSTIILLFEKGKVTIDSDILLNTEKDTETLVKMGEKIGVSMPGLAL